MLLPKLTVSELVDVAVARSGDAPFLHWGKDVWTYRDLGREVDRAAAAWLRLGVTKGDRVAFLSENRPEFLFAWLGLAKIGGILTAINTAFVPDEVAYLLEHSGAKFALVSPKLLHRLFEATTPASDLTRVVVLDEETASSHGSGARLIAYRRFLEYGQAQTPMPEVAEHDVISIIYTSGTTGRPKGVMQSHRNFVLTGQSYPSWLDIRERDRLYVSLPLFHINAQAYSTMGALAAGASLILVERFSARKFWPDILDYGITHFNFIGAMAVILGKGAPKDAERRSKVRVAYGGTKLPHDVQVGIESRLNCKIISGFGMSETTFGFVEDLHGERRPGSIGKPRQPPDPALLRTRARLVDDEGRDVPAGETGELLLQSCAIMLGYFRDEEATRRALAGGWLHTGDLLRRDDDGFYYFVDRKKDIIRRRGENISSVEVERVLLEHSAINGAAVVGVPSELTDEEVLACVTLSEPDALTPEQIVEWCSQRLAAFKVPRYVRIADKLPRTGSHKVQKAPLRENWQAQGPYYDRMTKERARS